MLMLVVTVFMKEMTNFEPFEKKLYNSAYKNYNGVSDLESFRSDCGCYG